MCVFYTAALLVRIHISVKKFRKTQAKTPIKPSFSDPISALLRIIATNQTSQRNIQHMTQNKSSSDHLAFLCDHLKKVAEDRDKTSFSALFDHYAPLIRSYSLAREPGADLIADDLTQDVMSRVWLKAGTYNESLANLNTWIFTLARNCRIDYLRRNSRHISDIDPSYIFDVMEDDSPGPFQQVHRSRSQDSIRTALKELPIEQSEVLVKVYLEGKSHQQTSTELKLPLGTVKSRVRLALKKLEVLVER
ncbi:MAG: RNA polymerase sigma factor (sigma-70 family) [Gammaproteobacteria bacterium]|jgi:RNA polymerase sigma factor (sigma-70 family)